MSDRSERQTAAQSLAQAIVDTIHEPFLVLDAGLRVLSASRSFYETFKVGRAQTVGCDLYALGDGQWNIPALRTLLETILPEKAAMDGFEVDHDFPGVGRRIMLLNARTVVVQDIHANLTILLAFTDITARRAIEADQAELLRRSEELLAQQRTLLQEMQHRVANSLQIIASILLIKARAVTSEETRGHLKDAHQRVLSVAQVQSHLHASGGVERIEVGPYLTKLCASLSASMIGDDNPIRLHVIADHGLVESDKAVSLGLIVTELVINAVKYAFPVPLPGAEVMVRFDSVGDDWTLTIADNGVGVAVKPVDAALPARKGGLGTVIVAALVKQLGAEMTSAMDAGLSVTIRRAGAAALPSAA